MVDINRIDKTAFSDCWNEIVSILSSIESDKVALKNLKNELSRIIGADSSKEANAIIKALIKKEQEGSYYDEESIGSAEELYNEFILGD